MPNWNDTFTQADDWTDVEFLQMFWDAFEERVKMYLHHAKMLVDVKGERKAMLEMRKFGHRYVSGEPGASHLRQQINVVTKLAELEALFS